MKERVLLPLFLVSLASVGFETALTRYFAVAKWSAYGYWVISIVMAGLALSGLAVALARPFLLRHARGLLAWLPVLLILAAALGDHATAANPFNPLQLQNPATLVAQLGLIGLYYLGLLPFFFLAGVFISLCFMLQEARIGWVYGADLTGAGAGALLVLLLMLALPPFRLLPALLPALALAALLMARASRHPWRLALATLLALGAGEALLLGDDPSRFDEFKPIYAALHVPGSRVLAERRSPRGLYLLLDDFTERVDTDLSNNAAMLGLPGPPRSLGLYRDGNRLAALPGPAGLDARYAAATLDALPYLLGPPQRVLLIGASGGFRATAALALGAARVDVVEPEPVLHDILRHGFGPVGALPADSRLRLRDASPLAAVRPPARYDLIDLSADFLDASETAASAFTVQALAADLSALGPGGIVSIPVSIREFPAYAVRMLATARAALRRCDLDPAASVVVVRSAWNARILLSNQPWVGARLAALRKAADDRSFDVSYYPGIDIAAARAGLYNDLPAVSFAAGTVSDGGPDDAVADEAQAALAGQRSASAESFDLSPITDDRPFVHSVLRLDHPGVLLRRLEVLPQAEIGPLVNLAVLAQALMIAALLLLAPLAGRRSLAAPPLTLLRCMLYFASLGLGFLFIELYAIEKAAFYLDDRASGFALVLSGLLIYSGLGSLLADRVAARPRRALTRASGVILLWCLLVAALAQPAMLASLALPWALRAGLLLLLLAPVGIALGLPFPLGLGRLGAGALLPWAWGLNGAFSVIATPLANLIALRFGFERVLLLAALLYLVPLITYAFSPARLPWPQKTTP